MKRPAYVKTLAKLNRNKVAALDAVYDWAVANGHGHTRLSDVFKLAPAILSDAYFAADAAAHRHALNGIALGYAYLVRSELRFTTGRGKSIREHCADHYVG